MQKKIPVSAKKYSVFNGLPEASGCKYFQTNSLAADISPVRTYGASAPWPRQFNPESPHWYRHETILRLQEEIKCKTAAGVWYLNSCA
jgi:hypothetical protein